MSDIGRDLQKAYDEGYEARDKEIVRCKDCKWFLTWKENGNPQGYGLCEMDGMKTHIDDWFCKDGDRKEQA